MTYDVAVLGGGIAGMATAARLQARGFSTLVIERHGQVGGCAGFFKRRGFSFDVGATTLVDFEPGGVGGQLLDELGLKLEGERLPGYVAWLPTRTVTLHRDAHAWHQERLKLGHSPQHLSFWRLMDSLADAFWAASRRGINCEFKRAIRCLPVRHWPLVRYLNWTLADALGPLRADKELCALLSMLVEDTVHASIDDAPLVNAALGITIRGAGLTRASGGMRGFWDAFVARYRALGGVLKVGTRAERVQGHTVTTTRGELTARHIVSALPLELTARVAGLQFPEQPRGGAQVVFLGVPDDEVSGQDFTHHQLSCGDHAAFISVSQAGDLKSAPEGHRAVMISTHCELDAPNLNDALLAAARRVYPRLGTNPVVHALGTPSTYEKYTGRPRGAVGGYRQSLRNSNRRAVSHRSGIKNLWLTGDGTWPGLGTVAACLSSRIVAEEVEHALQRSVVGSRNPSRGGLGPAVGRV
jgi:phytoene dehydrogenase-like protein